jgi:hypothetical protein
MMAFVSSTLTPHLSVQLINPIKGRGLFAEKEFEANEVVLVDKALISMVCRYMTPLHMLILP